MSEVACTYYIYGLFIDRIVNHNMCYLYNIIEV